jgi:hypothetical protein
MKTTVLVVSLLVLAGLLALALREVCVPVEDPASFHPIPIERREDRILWIKMFQRRDGRWVQCKPALWRALFF